MANQDVVKAAYRALSLKYHPDRNPGKESSCHDKMQQINNAYSILSDVGRRAVYDQTLTVTPKKAYTPPKADPVRPQPAYSPPPKPEPKYASPKYGDESGQGFKPNQTPLKPTSLKHHAALFLESFWKGLVEFSIELWNVSKEIFWPIFKWTFFGIFIILMILLSGGSGSQYDRRDDYYNRNRNRYR